MYNIHIPILKDQFEGTVDATDVSFEISYGDFIITVNKVEANERDTAKYAKLISL